MIIPRLFVSVCTFWAACAAWSFVALSSSSPVFCRCALCFVALLDLFSMSLIATERDLIELPVDGEDDDVESPLSRFLSDDVELWLLLDFFASFLRPLLLCFFFHVFCLFEYYHFVFVIIRNVDRVRICVRGLK